MELSLCLLKILGSKIDSFRFMELAEIGRCRASVSPPQTHQGGLLSSIYRLMSFHLDEQNGLLYVSTDKKIFTVSVSVQTVGRATR